MSSLKLHLFLSLILFFATLSFNLTDATAAMVTPSIEFEANDQPSNGNHDPGPADGDPVTLNNLNFRETVRDLSIRMPGTNVEAVGEQIFMRTYRSGSKIQGALGPGWDFSWNQFIAIEYQKKGATCFGVDPTVIGIYYFNGKTRIENLGQGGVLADMPEGLAAKRRAIGDLSNGYYPDSFEVRSNDGTIATFGHRTTTSSLFSAGCVAVYYLTEVKSRTLEKFTFNYNVITNLLTSVEDPYGRKIQLGYDGNGLLQTVQDYLGRTWTYSYTGTAPSRLEFVTTPPTDACPTGCQTKYVYEGTTSKISQIIDADRLSTDSAPYVQNFYSGTKVIRQIFGGTNDSGVPAGGQYRFFEEIPPSPESYGWVSVARKVVSVSPNGNVRYSAFDVYGGRVIEIQFTGRLNPEHAFLDTATVSDLVQTDFSSRANALNPALNTLKSNAARLPQVRSGEQASYTLLTDYNSEGLPTRVETEGQDARYYFDENNPDRFQHHNLLKQEWHPKRDNLVPPQGTDPLVKTFLWDPIYNQLRGKIMARGYDPSHVPPNGGSNSPGRYLKSWTFDYQEGSLSALSSLTSTWAIDTAQATAYAQVPEYTVLLPPMTAGGSSLGELNGDGAHTVGQIIEEILPSAQVYTDSSVIGGTFVAQTRKTIHRYNSSEHLIETIDPEGFSTTRTYYPKANPTGGGGGAGSVSGSGQLASVDRPEGVSYQFGFDLIGRLISVTLPRGFQSQNEYDALSRVTATINAKGDRKTNVYNRVGNLVEVRIHNKTPVLNSSTGLPVLNGNGEVVEQDNGDLVHTYVYDILDNIVEERKDIGGGAHLITQYRYDKDLNRVLKISPESTSGNSTGNFTSRVYDERGLMFTSTLGGVTSQFSSLFANDELTPPSSSPSPSTRTFTYGSARNITSRRDGAQHDWTNSYDDFQRLEVMTSPLGDYTEVIRDADGHDIRSSFYNSADTLLARIHTEYDEGGRIFETHRELFTSTTLPPNLASQVTDGPLTSGDGLVTERLALDAKGRVTSKVDDNLYQLFMEYDDLDRLIEERDGGNFLTTYAYDKEDNLIYSSKQEFNATGSQIFEKWNFYDELDRIVAHANHEGHAYRFLYDSRGNRVFMSDAKSSAGGGTLASLDLFPTLYEHTVLPATPINDHGNRMTYEYDGADRLLKTRRPMLIGGSGEGAVDPLQAGDGVIEIVMDYNHNSLIKERRDDHNNITSYEYDAQNRLKRTDSPDGSFREVTSFDGAGRPLNRVDQNGTSITYGYDSAGRLTSRIALPAGSVEGITAENFSYDGMNRITSAWNANSTVTRGYDSLSRILKETQNTQNVYSIYDGMSNLKIIRYPGGRQIDYTYDSANRIDQIQDAALSVAYPTLGAVVQNSYIGNRVEKRDYLFFGGQPRVTLSVGFDNLGRTSSTQYVRNSDGFVIDHQTYVWDDVHNKIERNNERDKIDRTLQYDSAYRLTSSIWDGRSPDRRSDLSDRSAIYTLDGVGNREMATGQSAGSYAMDMNDFPVNQYSSEPAGVRSYDENGNMRTFKRGGLPHEMAWDFMNRPVRFQDGAGVDTHVQYDVFGRRIQKQTGSNIQRFYYFGSHVVEDQDGSGNTVSTYVHGHSGVDDLVSYTYPDGSGGEDHYFYQQDDMGNVLRITDISANEKESYAYHDFGEPLDGHTYLAFGGSAFGNSYLFSGRRYDGETGFYYFRARYLDPMTGRFVSRDPMGDWYDPASFGNGATYAANNPYSKIDPTGLRSRDANRIVDIDPFPYGGFKGPLKPPANFPCGTPFKFPRVWGPGVEIWESSQGGTQGEDKERRIREYWRALDDWKHEQIARRKPGGEFLESYSDPVTRSNYDEYFKDPLGPAPLPEDPQFNPPGSTILTRDDVGFHSVSIHPEDVPFKDPHGGCITIGCREGLPPMDGGGITTDLGMMAAFAFAGRKVGQWIAGLFSSSAEDAVNGSRAFDPDHYDGDSDIDLDLDIDDVPEDEREVQGLLEAFSDRTGSFFGPDGTFYEYEVKYDLTRGDGTFYTIRKFSPDGLDSEIVLDDVPYEAFKKFGEDLMK